MYSKQKYDYERSGDRWVGGGAVNGSGYKQPENRYDERPNSSYNRDRKEASYNSFRVADNDNDSYGYGRGDYGSKADMLPSRERVSRPRMEDEIQVRDKQLKEASELLSKQTAMIERLEKTITKKIGGVGGPSPPPSYDDRYGYEDYDDYDDQDIYHNYDQSYNQPNWPSNSLLGEKPVGYQSSFKKGPGPFGISQGINSTPDPRGLKRPYTGSVPPPSMTKKAKKGPLLREPVKNSKPNIGKPGPVMKSGGFNGVPYPSPSSNGMNGPAPMPGRRSFCNKCSQDILTPDHHLTPLHLRRAENTRNGCKICFVDTFTSFDTYTNHLTSSRHRRMLSYVSRRKLKLTKDISKLEIPVPEYNADTAYGAEGLNLKTGLYCFMCCSFIPDTEKNRESHLKSKQHYQSYVLHLRMINCDKILAKERGITQQVVVEVQKTGEDEEQNGDNWNEDLLDTNTFDNNEFASFEQNE